MGARNMAQIYFLCTGNSCRSQMAAGFARQMLPKIWQVASAGLRATSVNPMAILVMAEVGIDIAKQRSTVIDPMYLRHCDLVITLCGDARDHCPLAPTTVQKQHWPLRDPALAQGTYAQRLVVFRQVRDQIAQRVIALKRELTP